MQFVRLGARTREQMGEGLRSASQLTLTLQGAVLTHQSLTRAAVKAWPWRPLSTD